jgi:hypothetical protein
MTQKRHSDSAATLGAGAGLDVNAFCAARETGLSAAKAGHRGNALRDRPQGAVSMAPDQANKGALRQIQDARIDNHVAIAFSKLSRFIRLDDKGQPQLDLSHVSHQDLAGLSFLRIGIRCVGSGLDQEIVVSFRVKMRDKLRSLKWLLRYCAPRERRAMAK